MPFIFGQLTILASAFCFYFATVIIRWSHETTQIDPAYYAFCRFLLGFLIVCIVLLARRQRPRPQKYHLLIGRALANGAAVLCFYSAVQYGSVAEANMLNMTYPVFVALFSWVFLRSQRDWIGMLMAPVAIAGIWLIISPGKMQIGLGSAYGLASGLLASAAMLYLNVSRRYHDVNTVLFFMFGIGSLLMLILFHNRFFWPTAHEFYYLLACSLVGIAGQFLVTVGFRYVSAVEGSIISSARILLAAMLGPLMVGEHPLRLIGWLGALLLFTANAVLALRRPLAATPCAPLPAEKTVSKN